MSYDVVDAKTLKNAVTGLPFYAGLVVANPQWARIRAEDRRIAQLGPVRERKPSYGGSRPSKWELLARECQTYGETVSVPDTTPPQE